MLRGLDNTTHSLDSRTEIFSGPEPDFLVFEQQTSCFLCKRFWLVKRWLLPVIRSSLILFNVARLSIKQLWLKKWDAELNLEIWRHMGDQVDQRWN